MDGLFHGTRAVYSMPGPLPIHPCRPRAPQPQTPNARLSLSLRTRARSVVDQLPWVPQPPAVLQMAWPQQLSRMHTAPSGHCDDSVHASKSLQLPRPSKQTPAPPTSSPQIQVLLAGPHGREKSQLESHRQRVHTPLVQSW